MIAELRMGNTSDMQAASTALLDARAQSDACAAPSFGARQRAMAGEHYQFIWRSLRRMGVGQAGVDDAAQRVFVLAAEKIAQIAPGKERSFLFQTAVRVAMSIRRDFARKREDPIEDDQELAADGSLEPEALLLERQRRRYLDELLDSLPIDLRAVFVLFEIEGMGAPEIATLLEVPVGTVASRLRRARATFRAASVRLRARLEGGRR